MAQTDKTLDIKGLVSPRSELITKKTLATMGPGQVLTVITTDRSTKQKLPKLCANLGCAILELKEDRGTLYFHIQKKAES